MNIASLLSKTAAKSSTLPAVIGGYELHLNYLQLAQRVASIAGYLRESLGLAAGDRVALIMKNCPQYIEILLGTLHAGLAAVPINAKLHKMEFDFILDNAGTSCLFVTDDFAEMFPANAAYSVISIGSYQYASACDHAPLPLQPCEPDALAWLFYTSGTTGKPKGGVLPSSPRSLRRTAGR